MNIKTDAERLEVMFDMLSQCTMRPKFSEVYACALITGAEDGYAYGHTFNGQTHTLVRFGTYEGDPAKCLVPLGKLSRMLKGQGGDVRIVVESGAAPSVAMKVGKRKCKERGLLPEEFAATVARINPTSSGEVEDSGLIEAIEYALKAHSKKTFVPWAKYILIEPHEGGVYVSGTDTHSLAHSFVPDCGLSEMSEDLMLDPESAEQFISLLKHGSVRWHLSDSHFTLVQDDVTIVSALPSSNIKWPNYHVLLSTDGMFGVSVARDELVHAAEAAGTYSSEQTRGIRIAGGPDEEYVICASTGGSRGNSMQDVSGSAEEAFDVKADYLRIIAAARPISSPQVSIMMPREDRPSRMILADTEKRRMTQVALMNIQT